MTTTLMPNPVELSLTESQMDPAASKGRTFMETVMYGLAAVALAPIPGLVVASNMMPAELRGSNAAPQQERIS